MFEIQGNLWKLPADIICVTTNGFVKADGKAVMGRGCAKEATKLIPGIEEELAKKIKTHGNNVAYLAEHRGRKILSFPVKHNWWEEASLELIERSCQQLKFYVNDIYNNQRRFIVVPRPGCGNGKLEWIDVKPICEEYFDDRFGVVTYV